MHNLIFTHGGGRLGNQLTTLSHLIAFAEEFRHHIRVIDVAFWPYQGLLKSLTDNPYCVLPASGKTPFSIGSNFVRQLLKPSSEYNNTSVRANQLHFWANRLPRCQSIYTPHFEQDSECFDLTAGPFINSIEKHHVTCLAGWPVRQWELFNRHVSRVRETIKFSSIYEQRSNQFIADLRERHDILIGLLIRQDDYNQFAQGKFFLSTQEYVRAAKHFLQGVPCHNPTVVIASGTTQDKGELSDLPHHFTTGSLGQEGHYIESLIQLSKCDFILSVPSTFAAWAAFLGKTEIAILSRETPVRNYGEQIAGSFDEMRRDSLFRQSVN